MANSARYRNLVPLIALLLLDTSCGGIENQHSRVTPESVTPTPSPREVWVTNPTPEGENFIIFQSSDQTALGDPSPR